MSSDAVRGQVEAAYAAWDEAFNRGDAKALASLYVDDATFLPATHDVVDGPTRIEAFFTPLLAQGLSDHRFELITVHEDQNSIAAAARWTATSPNADGSRATSSGIATHLFVKQPGGGLKLRLHTFN
ncbi:MAG: SgcJ/EcaC family oxidoreductase [Geminicoccaceae bacterium]